MELIFEENLVTLGSLEGSINMSRNPTPGSHVPGVIFMNASSLFIAIVLVSWTEIIKSELDVIRIEISTYPVTCGDQDLSKDKQIC